MGWYHEGNLFYCTLGPILSAGGIAYFRSWWNCFLELYDRRLRFMSVILFFFFLLRFKSFAGERNMENFFPRLKGFV